VFRQSNGRQMERDIVGMREENLAGAPLLREVMRAGHLSLTRPTLAEMRDALASDLAALPDHVKAIRAPGHVPVEFSAQLTALRDETAAKNV
jgi:hypothetical protein